MRLLFFYMVILTFLVGKSYAQSNNQNANQLVSFLEGKWHNYSTFISDNSAVKQENYKETMRIKNDTTITITAHEFKDGEDLTRDMVLIIDSGKVVMKQGDFMATGKYEGNVYYLKGYAGDKEYRFRLYTMGDKYVFHNEVWVNGEIEMINLSYLERE